MSADDDEIESEEEAPTREKPSLPLTVRTQIREMLSLGSLMRLDWLRSPN
jgi:hypothetical protein